MGYEQIGPAVGTLGSLIMGITIALQVGRRKANIWEGILALIGVVLIGLGFFLQFGFGPLWCWITAFVVVSVLVFALAIVLRRWKKDC